jgi:hypothetical protein
MNYLVPLTAFVILLASTSVSVTAKGVPCRAKSDEIVAGTIRIANGKPRNPGATKRTGGKTGIPFMRASFIARSTSAIGISSLVSAAQNQENSKASSAVFGGRNQSFANRYSRKETKNTMTEQELIALVADAIEDADSHLCSEGGEPPYEKMAVAAIEAIRSAIQETKLGQT